MRPFRFFFGVSLAVIMFFFFARFVVWALIAAAIMSVVFHIGRKAKNFFRNLRWENDEYYHDEYERAYRPISRFEQRGEDLFQDFQRRQSDFMTDRRSIRIQ